MSQPTSAQAPPVPMTAEEFLARYGHHHVEIVRGRIVEDAMPSMRHGKVCVRVAQLLANFADANDLGHVMSNDSFVVIQHDPLTVRGPDVSYYSYARLPKGDVPEGYLPVVPDLAVEVRSPSNTWAAIHTKVGEYLGVDIPAVLILDPESATATVYRPNELHQTFDNGDDLAIPDVLPGFAVPVKNLFE